MGKTSSTIILLGESPSVDTKSDEKMEAGRLEELYDLVSQDVV